MNVETRHHRAEPPARLVHAKELGHGVAQCLRAFVFAAKNDRRHRVAQHAGSDRVALGMVRIQEAFRRCPLDHLGQLPSQIHRILHTGLEALSTDRRMHVCGVAGQQHASVAVGRGLPGHIGEPGDRGGTVDPVIGPIYGDERLAEIAQGGFGCGSDVLFGHQDADPPPILQPAEGMDSDGVAADAPFRRLLAQLGLGDQVAGGRIPARELDAGGFADQTASAIAPDEIFRPQRLAIAQRDVNAGVVLRETRHLHAVIDRHRSARRPSRRVCARCGSATARARSCAGWESR